MRAIRLRRALTTGALAALAAVAGCGGPSGDVVRAPSPRGDALVAPAAMPDLQLRELAPGVWLHTSWLALADGTPFPSNGLVVREGDHLVLIDTGWGEALTERLLDRIADTVGLPVARAIVTHAHDDRLGGGAVLRRRGIPVLAGPLTRRLTSERGLPVPDTLAGLASVGAAVRVGSVEVFYPGPAHTHDNLMVWLPEHGILFGGCAVRPAATTSLGNVADADTIHWPISIERAERRYAAATLVVPSHGDVGGPELLRHTISLFPRREAAVMERASGTFVLQHSGTMTRGEPRLSVTVVPDAGTGDLKGLAGTMTIEIVDGTHFYEFAYTVADRP